MDESSLNFKDQGKLRKHVVSSPIHLPCDLAVHVQLELHILMLPISQPFSKESTVLSLMSELTTKSQYASLESIISH